LGKQIRLGLGTENFKEEKKWRWREKYRELYPLLEGKSGIPKDWRGEGLGIKKTPAKQRSETEGGGIELNSFPFNSSKGKRNVWANREAYCAVS